MRVLILIVFTLLVGCGGATNSATTTDSCGKATAEQTGIKICSFVATPTASESVTLKNYGTAAVILTGYTLWDENAYSNNSGQKTPTASDNISAGGTLTITTAGTPFVINDSGETIYLKDSANALLDSKSN